MVFLRGYIWDQFAILNVQSCYLCTLTQAEKSNSGRKQKVLQQFLSSIWSVSSPPANILCSFEVSNIRFYSVRYIVIVTCRKKSKHNVVIEAHPTSHHPSTVNIPILTLVYVVESQKHLQTEYLSPLWKNLLVPRLFIRHPRIWVIHEVEAFSVTLALLWPEVSVKITSFHW